MSITAPPGPCLRRVANSLQTSFQLVIDKSKEKTYSWL